MKKPVLIGLAFGVLACLAVTSFLFLVGEAFRFALLARWEAGRPPQSAAASQQPPAGGEDAAAKATSGEVATEKPAVSFPSHP